MEIINKDLLIELALNLDSPSLTRLCQTSKRMNKLICNNQTFWRKKIEKERPGILNLIKIQIWNNKSLDYKEIYEDLYLNNYTFSLKYIRNPLQIYGAIQGILEEYDFTETMIHDGKLKIGDKAWIIVTNRPDFSFEAPILVKNKKEALEIVLKEIEFQLEDEIIDKEKYLKELNKNGKVSLEHIQFMMKEITVL